MRHVFAVCQTVGQHLDLGAGGNPHVVGQRSSSSVTHRLGISNQVADAVAHPGAGDLLVGGLEVRLTPHRVGVQLRLDHPSPDDPDLARIVLQRIGDFSLVHAPLDQQFALHRAPELQGVDRAVRVGHEHGLRLAFSRSLGRVDVQPVLQAVATVVVQDPTDGRVVIPFHPQQALDGSAGELVSLEDVAVLGRGAVRRPVDVERVHPFPVERQAVLDLEFERPRRAAFDPRELLARAHHRALDHRVRERYQVVDERIHRGVVVPFLQLVLHLVAHASHALVGLVLHHRHPEVVYPVDQVLHGLGRHHRLAHGHVHLDAQGFLSGFVGDLHRHLRGQAGLCRRLHVPGLLSLGAEHHVLDPGTRCPALVGRQHHVDLGAVGLLDLGQYVRVVLPPALPYTLEQALLDRLLLGRVCVHEALLDVRRQVGDQFRGLLGFGRFLLVVEHLLGSDDGHQALTLTKERNDQTSHERPAC